MVDARQLRVGAAADDAHHAVAQGKALHLGPHGDHGARNLQPHGVGIAKVGTPVGPLAMQQVGPVDADGGVAHQQVVRAHLGDGDLARHQHFGAAEVIEHDGLHGAWGRCGLFSHRLFGHRQCGRGCGHEVAPQAWLSMPSRIGLCTMI